MVKVLTAGGRGNSIPFGPVYFSKDYVRRGWLSNKTYPQGGRGVVLRVHKFLGRVTHVDLRLPDGEYLLEVPIDYIRRPSIDAAPSSDTLSRGKSLSRVRERRFWALDQ